MYGMKGIYGVATYLKGQRAKIWYDADHTDSNGISEWIFSPAVISIRNLPDDRAQKQNYKDREIENLPEILSRGVYIQKMG